MANWSGVARTNFVKIKNLDDLLVATQDLPINVVPHPEAAGYVSFDPEENDSGSFDMVTWAEDGEELEWSWSDLCAQHLFEGQVLIVMTIGSEKLRYLTGFAEAYDWFGNHVFVTLNDIYAKAAAEFGVPEHQIATATYTDLPPQPLTRTTPCT